MHDIKCQIDKLGGGIAWLKILRKVNKMEIINKEAASCSNTNDLYISQYGRNVNNISQIWSKIPFP